MLYVLRLSSGDCVVVAAEDEKKARAIAGTLGLEKGETIAAVRPLSRLAVRFSPTDSASLEVNAWDDSTLDDILLHEYPILNEALKKANSVPFMSSPNRDKPVLDQLRGAHQENAEIIRQGLRQEIERLASKSAIQRHKTAHK